MRNLSTHFATLGFDHKSISTYEAEGVSLGSEIITRREPGFWTYGVIFCELQKKGVPRSEALRIAQNYKAVLVNMSKPAYNVTRHEDTFSVGTREFFDRSDALRHERHLHIVMALDALTSGLYFGKMWKSGMVVHTPETVGTFSRRAAQLIKQEIGHSLDPATLDRLDSEKWYRDVGTAARGKGQNPLYSILRGQYNESPLFWGIIPRLHAIDRSKTERVDPRIVQMLGMEPCI
jgi:hypothetical protein